MSHRRANWGRATSAWTIGLVTAVVVAGCGPPPAPPSPDGTIVRVSHAQGGEGGGQSFGPTTSGDGGRVAFESTAWDLVPGDPNAYLDVYVWDRASSVIERITGGNNESASPSISADGRSVAFTSTASDLAPDDRNRQGDVFLWDAATGTTTRITDGDSASGQPAMSADGGHVAFDSFASNLAPGDTDFTNDVFVWDRATGTTMRIPGGEEGNSRPSISADGRYVVFESWVSKPVAGATGVWDLYMWDRTTGATTRITDGNGGSHGPVVSADGGVVAFSSAASNLVPGDTNDGADVFLWEAAAGTTRRISDGNGHSSSPSISATGDAVAFSSWVSDGLVDVYLWDAATGITRITDGNDNSYGPAISADGDAITFASWASNLVPDDSNRAEDIFAWYRSE
ncbi:MAG TPA: hypothetical protein VK306_14915 [Acidimicrobiales bacterium]|nr:hypothetical protein [Acidimicrobiales bacterium]